MFEDRVFLIAEAGVNHNGCADRALAMVDAAAEAGADAVKFQTWKTENVVTLTAQKSDYQAATTPAHESQFDMLKKLELSHDQFRTIKDRCDEREILFLSTADEIESATFLDELQPMFKVGSAELTDWPYLRRLAAFGKPVFLSTGMGNMDEISSAIDVLKGAGLSSGQITLLHCVSAYPVPFRDANLRALRTLAEAFRLPVGYSDHTLGIEAAVAAVALGAVVIEKHFTLDPELPGPDHRLSLSTPELKKLVDVVRHVEEALGDGVKKPMPSEQVNMAAIRKSIVARKAIARGERFTEDNLSVKRPASGIPPTRWGDVLGRPATRDFKPDEFITI